MSAVPDVHLRSGLILIQSDCSSERHWLLMFHEQRPYQSGCDDWDSVCVPRKVPYCPAVSFKEHYLPSPDAVAFFVLWSTSTRFVHEFSTGGLDLANSLDVVTQREIRGQPSYNLPP